MERQAQNRHGTSEIERRTIRKVSWRLLPLIVTIYFVAYMDRTNVGFAALTMKQDIGLSRPPSSAGCGIFFIGYFLFEVPGTCSWRRWGRAVWIARIMFTWGLLSAAMAFIVPAEGLLRPAFPPGRGRSGLLPRNDPAISPSGSLSEPGAGIAALFPRRSRLQRADRRHFRPPLLHGPRSLA